MRNALLVSAALVPLLGAPSGAAERVTPIFSDTSWRGIWTHASGGCAVVKEKGRLPKSTVAGETAWKIQITGSGGKWMIGIPRGNWSRMYVDGYLPSGVLELRIRGEKGGETLQVAVADSDRDGKGPEKEVWGVLPVTRYVSVTRQWQTVRIPLKDYLQAGPGLDLADVIQLVLQPDGQARPMTVYLSKMAFRTTSPEKVYPAIKVDQLGYTPDMRKVARLSAPAETFAILSTEDSREKLTGTVRPVMTKHAASGDDIWEADFSELRAPGVYRLFAGGLDPSARFIIGEDVYDQLYVESMRFYYYQRCGMKLDEKYAGRFAHEACHLNDAKLVRRDGGEGTSDATGGWHDAGDHNKYAGWIGSTVFSMLNLYDLEHEKMQHVDFGIPESGNGVPDLLEEVKWELDWALKMQVKTGLQAGLVFDRVHPTGSKGSPNRKLFPPTNEATATCATVWARAARTFRYVPALRPTAETYLAAARKAYDALLKNKPKPTQVLEAAACLYDATGEERYLADAKKHFHVVGGPDPFIWSSHKFPVATLATSSRDGDGLRDSARAKLVAAVDRYVQAWREDGYGVPIYNPDHYCWSSNNFIGHMAQLAVMAHTFRPQDEYRHMAEDVLHYYLGRNALCTSFVTGYGNPSGVAYHGVKHAKPTEPNGLIGGGVNQWEPKGITNFPAKSYRPDAKAWTLNEVAIYYNAPLAFLAGHFAELRNPEAAVAKALEAVR